MSKRNFLVDIDLSYNQLLNPVLHNRGAHPGVTPSFTSTGYTYYNAVSHTPYTYAPANPNSDVDGWLDLGLPEGAGVTDLGWVASTSTVTSSTGNNTIITLADTTNPGLLSSTDWDWLNNKTIVGISGTKVQFNTALTDGDFLFVGDITDTNDYVTAANFNTGSGLLTLTRLSGGTVTENLDGRYQLTGTTDNYVSWDLYSDGTLRGAIIKNENVNFVGGSGISLPYTTTLDNTLTINHTNSITAGTASGGSGAIGYGGSIVIPTVTYDTEGHVTGKGTTTYTLPSASTNFDIQANGGTAVNIGEGENINFINGNVTTAVMVSQTNPTVTFNVNNDSISNGLLANMVQNTVKVNATTSTANPTDLGLTANTALGRKSTGNIVPITIETSLSGGTGSETLVYADAVVTYVDNAVTGALYYKGGYNAGTNTPDLEAPTPGDVSIGFTYTVTFSGDFFTEAVQVGDMLIAEVNDPTTLADWTVVNKNIPDIVLGDLTEATSTILTIVGGTNAVNGTGTTIEIDQASSGVDGYLSGTDWTKFNTGAISSLTTTGNSGAATFVANTLNIPIYANDNTTYDYLATNTTGGALLSISASTSSIDSVKLADATDGAILAEYVDASTIKISHGDTSTQASMNNGGRTYIQDITLDTYGHVTGLATATETVVDTTNFNVQANSGTAVNISATENINFIDGTGTLAAVVNQTNPTVKYSLDYIGTNNFIDSATNLEGTAISTLDTIVYHDATDNNIKKGLVSDLPFNNNAAANNGQLTVQGTGVLGGVGLFTADQAGNTTISITHDAVTRSDTTSTASPAHGATFDVVNSVTTSTEGHVTAIDVKTVTLPTVPSSLATKFAQTLTGVTTSHVVTHNLNTRDVTATVYTNSSTYDVIECEVRHTSVNTLTFNFNVAPADGAYRVVIIG